MGNSDEVALSEVSSKQLYEAFRNKKQVPPTAQTKLKAKNFPTFQWTGKKFIRYPLQLRLKLKSENFNIRF